MAHAVINKLKPEPPPIDSVVLTLSEAEAVVLYRVLTLVGGDEKESYRKYTDQIYQALKTAGIKKQYTETYFHNSLIAKIIDPTALKNDKD